VIEQRRADRRESSQIVFVRCVIAVPGDNIQRRLPDIGGIELTAPFDVKSGGFVLIFKSGNRRQEIARIGETVSSDRPAIG
jgi:hypothetical protein